MGRILVGNVMVAAMAWGWWRWTAGDRQWFLAGLVLLVAAVGVGLAMGVWCAIPNRKRQVKRPTTSTTAAEVGSVFDSIGE